MKNKVLLIIWVILLIGIFTLLTYIGFIHKKDVKKYKDYEEVLITASRSYTSSKNMYPKKGSKIIIKIEDLINEGFVDKKDIVDGCSGSIIVKYDSYIDYFPNIKCKYYKSVNK